MSSSDSLEKAIDEYQEECSGGNSTDESSSGSSNSSGGNSMDEEYISGIAGVPLEVIQEEFRKASGSQAGTSSNVPLTGPLDEEEVTVYSCAVEIPSKIDEQRLNNLKIWYQIPNELNPRLPVCGEWCCDSHSGIGVYEAYLLGGSKV